MKLSNICNCLILLVFLGAGLPAHSYDSINVISILSGSEPVTEENISENNLMCGQGAKYPMKSCELGAGFLCVNTPPLSIVETSVLVKGTIDLKNNSLSTITASIQNEYTNEYNQIKFDKPDSTSNCWNSGSGFCLDSEGYFSILLPLGEKYGPYTILVTATRASGTPSKEKIRISRVVAPKLTKENIKIEKNGSGAQINISFLDNCQSCDFYGISTGGLEITATNIINASDGGTKQVGFSTNVSTGAGSFSFCMPVESGSNNITITACNAATGFDVSKCPTVKLEPLGDESSGTGLIWTTPLQNFYGADVNPSIDLSFKIGGTESKSCDETNILLSFNRDPEEKICPDGSGIYTISLNPEAGINIGVIQDGEKAYPFSFGWGEIVSPYDESGRTKTNDELWIPSAGGFAVNKSFLTDTVRSLANNYLKSDDLKNLLVKVTELTDTKKTPTEEDLKVKEEIKDIRSTIPMCGAGEESSLNFGITSPPKLGLAEIPQIEFEQDAISFVLNLKDVAVTASVTLKDGSNDALLPLIVAFRKVYSPIRLEVDRTSGTPKFLLTSDSTDCEYKSKNACTHRPAILVPKDFLGAASKGGAFVACDASIDSRCDGLNQTNMMTGLVSMTVLDTINELLYCDGSAYITYLIRNKMKDVPIQVGCAETNYPKAPFVKFGNCDDNKGMFTNKGWIIPLGLDLLNNQFNVTENGIFGVVPALVGDEDFYSGLPDYVRKNSTGYIRRPFVGSNPTISSNTGVDFGVALGEEFINAILFLLTEQSSAGGGLLDWDYHDIMLNNVGFDAAKECDGFKPKSSDDKPPTLCNLRPRVGELLGSALTANGYFPQKQPIMLRLRGNKLIAPHIGFFQRNGKQYIDIQFANVDTYFYILETETTTDQYGNMILKTDGSGRPIIRSMNPNDPNPENGPIVKFKVSAMIALEISKIATDPEDASKLSMTIRTDPDLSKIFFQPVNGGNATVIPDESLISALNEKIKYGISIYSEPKKAIKFKIPKDIAFDKPSIGGIQKISFGKDGVQMGVEQSQEYLDILLKFIFTQALQINSETVTFTMPE